MQKLHAQVILFIVMTIVFPIAIIYAAIWQLNKVPSHNFLHNELPLLEAALYKSLPHEYIPLKVQQVINERKTEVDSIVAAYERQELSNIYKTVKNMWVMQYSHYIFKPAIVLAVIMACVGIFSFLFVNMAARRSLKSRQTLFKWFNAGLRLLPFMLLGVSLPFIIALLLLCAGFLLHHYAGGNVTTNLEMIMGAVVFVCVIIIISLLTGAFKLLRKITRPEPYTLIGTILTPDNAPKVWQTVNNIAERCKLPLPANIVLGFEFGFFVTNGGTICSDNQTPVERTGAAKPETTLYLYLPLMLILETEEFESIIGHELGHLRSADLEYREKFSCIYTKAYDTLEHLAAKQSRNDEFSQLVLIPAKSLALFFLNAFSKADMYWSRERELAADSTAAKAAGNYGTALALARSMLYGSYIAEIINEYRAKSVSGNLLGELKQRLMEFKPPSLDEILEKEQTHPFDTHPCLRERLANLNMLQETDALNAAAVKLQPNFLINQLGL